LVQFAPNNHTLSGPVSLADGVIFSNISAVADSDMSFILESGANAQLRIPAVQITPVCETFGTKDYSTVTPSHDIVNNPAIKIICNAGPGLVKYSSQAVDESFNSSSTANDTNDIEYLWNRNSLYTVSGTTIEPQTPEDSGI
jgi:hypothetical protein